MNRFDGLGDAGLRDTLFYVLATPEPVTADDAAAALRIHRTVARSRLERLLRAGLVETRFARRNGRAGPGAGRPSKLYAPAPEGRPLEFPPRRLATLVGRLLQEIPDQRRQRVLRQVGADYGGELARAADVPPAARPREGLEAVCAGLRSLGFPAVVEEVGPTTALISAAACPLRPLVREHPDAAELDRGMWAGLVEHGVRGLAAADVACGTDGCCDSGGACRVTLTLPG
jgi:predicted ArsR family transcriptional regulator